MVYFPWIFYTVRTVSHFLVKFTGIYTKHIIIYVNNRLKYAMQHNYQVTGFPLTLTDIKKLLFEFVNSHSKLINTFCISMLCINNALLCFAAGVCLLLAHYLSGILIVLMLIFCVKIQCLGVFRITYYIFNANRQITSL